VKIWGEKPPAKIFATNKEFFSKMMQLNAHTVNFYRKI